MPPCHDDSRFVGRERELDASLEIFNRAKMKLWIEKTKEAMSFMGEGK